MVGKHFGGKFLLVNRRVQQRVAAQGQDLATPFQKDGLGRAAAQINRHYLRPLFP
jgi:hypothetical protein